MAAKAPVPTLRLTDTWSGDSKPIAIESPAVSDVSDSFINSQSKSGEDSTQLYSYNGAEIDSPNKLDPTKDSKTPRNLDASDLSKSTSLSSGAPNAEAARSDPARKLTRQTTIDPLSAHILQRTGTQNIIPSKLRSDQNRETNQTTSTVSSGSNTAGVNGAAAQGPSEAGVGERKSLDPVQRKTTDPPQSTNKEKKKGVSFLSRIIGGKKKGPEEEDDDESMEGDRRTEGIDAHVFSQPIGYIPQYPPPPKYIRVRASNKPGRDFNRLFLAQELYRRPYLEENGKVSTTASVASAAGSQTSLALPKHKSGAIWAMKFSLDGRFLAAGGQDKLVRVWPVLSSSEDRHAFEKEEDQEGNLYNGGVKGVRLNAPVFRAEPVQEYAGHTADVLDLSWSKNNFLLSSSMDKTVRLWHVTQKACLCCFQHSDFVTSIVFHPRDDRFFLAGSLDSKLRLWSIPDKSVAYWQELPDLITAVAFTPDGKHAIAGCLNGLCLFYETEGLRYHTQVHVRSTHGRNAKGSKITGIESITFPPDDPNGEMKLLITSNDSRVRMYNFRDKSLETKFKGYENTCSQIHASFSDDAKYIISGSEDRKVYVWNVGPNDSDKKDKRPMEYFEAHSAIVTCAILAPTKTRQLLGSSGDPIYDLCNPPPVTLVSRSDSMTSSKVPVESGVDTPIDSSRPQSQRSSRDGSLVKHTVKTVEVSPQYAARSAHYDGQIIVTADYTGRIKIFRQDCAFIKRKSEQWENSSAISKRILHGSSHRASMSHNSPDRILSWRNSVSSNHSASASIRTGRQSTDTKSRTRSISPRKSLSQLSIRSQGNNYVPSIPSVKTMPMPSASSPALAENNRLRAKSLDDKENKVKPGTSSVPVKGLQSYRTPDLKPATDSNPLLVNPVTNQSMAFWDVSNQPSSAAGGLMPGNMDPDRRPSVLTLEGSASEVFSSDGEELADSTSDDDGVMKCKKCGGTTFSAKKVKTAIPGSAKAKSEHKLQCQRCGTFV